MQRRQTLLTLAALLQTGCSIRPLAVERTQPLPSPESEPAMRPPAAGQRWTYRRYNVYNGQLLATEVEEVAEVGPQVIVRRTTTQGESLPEERQGAWGQLLRDPVWDLAQSYEAPVPLWPQALRSGASASVQTQYRLDAPSYRLWINVYATVQGWERLRVPAGSFDTLRVERLIRFNHVEEYRNNCLRHDTLWLVPAIGRWAARETQGEYLLIGSRPALVHEDHFRWELSDWR
jgi:hypothetical protein